MGTRHYDRSYATPIARTRERLKAASVGIKGCELSHDEPTRLVFKLYAGAFVRIYAARVTFALRADGDATALHIDVYRPLQLFDPLNLYDKTLRRLLGPFEATLLDDGPQLRHLDQR